MVEALFDALTLVHNHPILQFPAVSGAQDAVEDEDFFESQQGRVCRSVFCEVIFILKLVILELEILVLKSR